jgi:hypothetical protein
MSAADKTEQATDSPAKEESHGRLRISNMLHHLYEAAEPNLSDEELELMSSIAGHVQLQAENMAEIVDGLATLISNDDGGNGDFKRRTPTLLWQLSYQFDLLAGLMALSDSAKYKLENPEH